jgi:hypothetical protein
VTSATRGLQAVLFMVGTLLGCTDEEPWGQRQADSALWVAGYDGDHRALFQLLEDYSKTFGLSMFNGSGQLPKGYLVNVEIGQPSGVYIRVFATDVDPRLTALIFVRSGVEEEVRKYSDGLKSRLEGRFGAVIDFTKSGLEKFESRDK